MLTAQPAEVFGIRDRGRLALGLAADVTVFDPATVGCAPLRRVRDFPAGADRLVADATGIRAVVVNGVVDPRGRPRRVDADGAAARPRAARRAAPHDAIPIISADSHITEPPNTYVDYIDADVARPRAAHASTSTTPATSSSIDGMKHAGADRARRRGRQAGRGDPPHGRALRGAAPRRLGSRRAHGRPGARRRRRRDHLPDRRHGALQPPDFDYKKACFDAYNRWIAEYCGAHPDAPARRAARRRCASPEEGIADLQRDQGARPARRDDARATRPSRTTTRPSTTTSGEAAIELGLPLSFHILTTREDARRRARPEDERLPRRSSAAARTSWARWCSAASSSAIRSCDRLRRGRRRLGAALHVPHGPRLQAAPQLAAAGPGALEAAVGVLPREHLHDVPGRLGRVPDRRPDELAPPDVGQRLPAQRLDLAVVAGDARRAHRHLTPEQSARILCDNVAELYGIDVARLEAVSG